jgi:hypothetical protein
MAKCTCIKLKTVDQRLTVVQQPVLASGDVGTVRVEYALDSFWDGFMPHGTFYNGKTPEDVYEQQLTDGACEIPWEALQEDGILYIGLRGIDDSGLIKTAAPVRYRVEKGSPRGSAITAGPTPDVYLQLLRKLDEIATTEGKVELSTYAKQEDVDAIKESLGNLDGGLSSTEKTLLLSLFKNAAYTADMSATIAQLETLWSETPETPENGVEQIGKVLSIVSGVTITQNGSVLAIA